MSGPSLGITQSTCYGSGCFVPVSHFDGTTSWGHIHQHQVTKGGVMPPRVHFVGSDLPRDSINNLRRIGPLKWSLVGVDSVKVFDKQDGLVLTESQQRDPQPFFKAKFFSTLQRCHDREKNNMWGPTIIIGANHKHVSVTDGLDASEQRGLYRTLPPVPSPVMMGQHGLMVPWVAPPLSDRRSYGRWKIRYGRFYVRHNAIDEDEENREIVVHRVGRYVFGR